MKGINDALATTLAACGDVNRNVMAPPTPATSRLVERVQQDARRLSKALLPSTKAYHQIWVEGQELNLAGEESGEFVDPLYGKTYLPRKFKTAFVIPPLNDIDIFTNCLGFIAISEGDTLVGYNLAAGGGLGMSHGNAQTFPRMADVIGFLRPEQIETAAKAVVTIHRILAIAPTANTPVSNMSSRTKARFGSARNSSDAPDSPSRRRAPFNSPARATDSGGTSNSTTKSFSDFTLRPDASATPSAINSRRHCGKSSSNFALKSA